MRRYIIVISVLSVKYFLSYYKKTYNTVIYIYRTYNTYYMYIILLYVYYIILYYI